MHDVCEQRKLELVKNYICGNIMRLMDGPFQTITFLKILVTEYGSPDAFQDLLHAILTTDATKLRQLAEKYFITENMTQVTAGA